MFAGGLMALLVLMVGVPLLMVVLMSLRTGFPGEGGPLTLANFIAVYSSPGTYKVLAQYASVCLRDGARDDCFCCAAGLACSCAPTCRSKERSTC